MGDGGGTGRDIIVTEQGAEDTAGSDAVVTVYQLIRHGFTCGCIEGAAFVKKNGDVIEFVSINFGIFCKSRKCKGGDEQKCQQANKYFFHEFDPFMLCMIAMRVS